MSPAELHELADLLEHDAAKLEKAARQKRQLSQWARNRAIELRKKQLRSAS